MRISTKKEVVGIEMPGGSWPLPASLVQYVQQVGQDGDRGIRIRTGTKTEGWLSHAGKAGWPCSSVAV